MQQQIDVGMILHNLDNLLGPDRLVDVAITRVSKDIATSCLLPDDRGQKFIRQEQNGLVGRNRADDFRGVRRRAAIVALGFYRRRGY